MQELRPDLSWKTNGFPNLSLAESSGQSPEVFYESTGLIQDDNVDDLESEKPRWIPFSQMHPEDIADFGKDIHDALMNLSTEKG